MLNARILLHSLVVATSVALTAAALGVPGAEAAPPVKATVDVTAPVDGSSSPDTAPVVSGKATSPTGIVHVRVDGGPVMAQATVSSRGTWSTRVSWSTLGSHQICAEVRSTSGTVLAVDCASVTTTPDPARFAVTWPEDGGTTLTLFQAKGTCQDGTVAVLTLDGAEQRTAPCTDGRFWADFLTTAGTHTLVTALTYEGQVLRTISRTFTTEAPPAVDVEITDPAADVTVSSSSVGVSGTTNQPGTKVLLTVNGGTAREAYVDQDGSWRDGVQLTYGDNLVCASSSDLYGTSDRDCVMVRFAIDPSTLVLTRPADGDVSGTFIYYEGSCHTGTQLRIELDGELYSEDTCYWEHFGGSIPYVADGPHTVRVTMLWDGTEISSVSAGVVVDTLAPAPPTVLTPDAGSTIRSAPVQVTGTAEAGATVELLSSTGAPVIIAPVAADGTWTMSLDRAYLESQGVVTGARETLRLRFEAVDSVGNRSYTTVVTRTVRMR